MRGQVQHRMESFGVCLVLSAVSSSFGSSGQIKASGRNQIDGFGCHVGLR